MHLPKSIKAQIKKERDATFLKMSADGVSKDDWNELNKKYQAYNEMLKPSCKLSPDTMLVVAGNLLGIVLILKHEKIDIVTSKALSFVLKGRV